MILLTDEENPFTECTKCKWEPDSCNMEYCEGDKIEHAAYEAGAKAQLKKVANHIRDLPTDGHDKWYYYHQDLAEVIEKECDG